jgi:hypothetical protein
VSIASDEKEIIPVSKRFAQVRVTPGKMKNMICNSMPIKNDVLNDGIKLKKKVIQQSRITILPMFPAGDSPIILKLFLLGLRGFLWVRLMGSRNSMGLGLWAQH